MIKYYSYNLAYLLVFFLCLHLNWGFEAPPSFNLISGTVKNPSGNPVEGARVRFQNFPEIFTVTDAEGNFNLSTPPVPIFSKSNTKISPTLKGTKLQLPGFSGPAPIWVVYNIKGKKIGSRELNLTQFGTFEADLTKSITLPGLYFVMVIANGENYTLKVSILPTNQNRSRDDTPRTVHGLSKKAPGKTEVDVDALIVSAMEYVTKVCKNTNFEQHPEYKASFKTLVPNEILESISIISKQEIIPEKTLLFIDEIQECPRAITSLRYFYEQSPELHVIAAGSLLEFSLEKQEFKMPVGRIEFQFLYPLTFSEFLTASGEKKLREKIESSSPSNPMPDVLHEKALKLIRTYLILGGMPQVLNEYFTKGNMIHCLRLQANIINTYRADFSKYAKIAEQTHLQKIFDYVPKSVGKKFQYSKVDPEIRSHHFKKSVDMLQKAGVIKKVKRTSGAGLPLEPESSEKHYKTIFLDVGLMQNVCGIDSEIAVEEDLLKINQGSLTEQLVGQEILAYTKNISNKGLYYWERDARNSAAEIDYLISQGPSVIPIEVKSGFTGRLKSLKIFMEKYRSKIGIKVSQDNFSETGKIINIPLYAIQNLFATRDN